VRIKMKLNKCKLILSLLTVGILILAIGVGIAGATMQVWVATNGDDRHNGTQEEPFGTLQKAIDTVEPGGTVNVMAGIYNENVVVNKMLTLRGEGREETIIQDVDKVPNTVLTISADGVTISGFTIHVGTGEPKSGFRWPIKVIANNTLLTDLHVIKEHAQGGCIELGELDTGGFTGFTLTDSIVDSAYRGVDIWSDPSSSKIIIRNVDFNVSGDRIILLDDTQGGILAENTFVTNGVAIVVVGSSDNIKILDNQFLGSGAADSKAIQFVTRTIVNMGDIAISGNYILGFNTGIFLTDTDLVTSGISIHNNNIVGNAYGVQNIGEGLVDATKNWWGDASGPAPNGSGDTVSGNVDYDPWYVDASKMILSNE